MVTDTKLGRDLTREATFEISKGYLPFDEGRSAPVVHGETF